MAVLMEYECPACGGGLAFDISLQKVKCPYCDSEFEMDALKAKDTVLQVSSEPEHWEEGEQLNTFVCSSCGGEILCDASTAATSCPYCESPVVMQQRLSGSLRPDLVIPFKLDKEAAKAALLKHISGKVLLPRCFKSENRIEKIRGIYVPFWLFDGETDGDVTYRTTKVRTWSDSRYNYTNTRHYEVRRAGSTAFQAVPVDGSGKMPNDLMESIEPYDLSQGVDFQTAYLAGYLADKYDVPPEQAEPRAHDRMVRSTEDLLRNTVVGYTTVTRHNGNVNVTPKAVRYALMPVWMLNTKYQGKDYTFAMNAQTGKMVGDLPMSKLAYWLWFGGISVAGTLLAWLVGCAMG